MKRRHFSRLTVAYAALLCALPTASHGVTLNDVSRAQATQGVKAALENGVRFAIDSLGRNNGFLGNDKVRILLPGYLEDAAGLLRRLGQGARLDELSAAMNHAAEAAVPLARDVLVGAVKSISVQDAKNILLGGETSVTQFFADKTRVQLGDKFLPMVKKTTQQVRLADKYNRIASQAASFGLLKGEEVSLERYVTGKTLDGLYFMIGEEEKKIRQDPVGTGSAVLQRVFGAMK
ncbi:DUF4197 domain-containing protein [Rhodoferax sp. BLA1]|uniref:DUF4197 domain-containing protein n=1 Tax=Rhodoferax sp. BLA1 TaxID=2576062 RepID=UPI0015D307DC|nr:DUF4197 domain-containing protein [Rhodoferax sp. BLA1]